MQEIFLDVVVIILFEAVVVAAAAAAAKAAAVPPGLFRDPFDPTTFFSYLPPSGRRLGNSQGIFAPSSTSSSQDFRLSFSEVEKRNVQIFLSLPQIKRAKVIFRANSA